MLDAAAGLPTAAVHPGQRVVSGRPARRVRLLNGRAALVLVAAASRPSATVAATAAGQRSRGGDDWRRGPRLPRQRSAPRQPRSRPLFGFPVVLFLC